VDLSDQLERQLTDAVLDFIGFDPSPQLVRGLIGSEALTRMPRSLRGGYGCARWVVRYSLSCATPERFVQVVQGCDPGGALVELHALVGDLQRDPSAWSARAAARLWVPAGWPFIDRAGVREALAVMAEGRGPSALAIEGPFGHGKRTMAEYIRYLARETQSFDPAVVEIRREPEPGVLLSIVTQLSTALGQPAELDTTHVEPERQGTIFAREIAQLASASPTTTWLVANIVDHSGLEEGVVRFVDELLGLVQRVPAVGDKLRVLVMCDQLTLLELENPPPLESRHTLAQVTDADIRAWFEAAAPGKPRELYELTTQTVIRKLQSANPALPRRLRLVSHHCAVAQRQLAAVTGD
jgi:hypothetical protein